MNGKSVLTRRNGTENDFADAKFSLCYVKSSNEPTANPNRQQGHLWSKCENDVQGTATGMARIFSCSLKKKFPQLSGRLAGDVIFEHF